MFCPLVSVILCGSQDSVVTVCFLGGTSVILLDVVTGSSSLNASRYWELKFRNWDGLGGG